MFTAEKNGCRGPGARGQVSADPRALNPDLQHGAPWRFIPFVLCLGVSCGDDIGGWFGKPIGVEFAVAEGQDDWLAITVIVRYY